MWAIIWSKRAKYVRDLHAKIMDNPQYCSNTIDSYQHIRYPNSNVNRSARKHIKVGGEIRDVDDTTSVFICFGIPNYEVFASSEQDNGHGCYSWDFICFAYFFYLAFDAEARLGFAGRRGGSERLVVVHGHRKTCVYFFGELW